MTTSEGIGDATGAAPDDLQPVIDQLTIDGLIASAAGAFRLTESGTDRVAGLVETEREAWGVNAATAALDAFLPIDHRVKAVVTAWQVRDDQPGQVLNDHADSAYDAGVLARLAEVHEDTQAWLGGVESAVPRLATYRARLDQAVKRAGVGDGRYVASPRVDSYHGVWFELHEDLIQLAGRTREAESAAGRA